MLQRWDFIDFKSAAYNRARTINTEFSKPAASDCEGGLGYFAREMKRAGELSHDGEQA